MPGMTKEQEDMLAKINSTEGGKKMSPAQKAIVVKFGTIDIKADKPKGMSIDIPEGPQVKPKKRELPTMDD